MPFVEEKNLKLMLDELEESNLKKEEIGNELKEAEETLTSLKKKYRLTSISLGLLLGILGVFCYYLYTNGAGSPSITETELIAIKNKESIRVLDSIERANKRALRNAKKNRKKKSKSSSINSRNLDKTIGEVKSKTTGETIYSVQVGAFYNKKKFPLLSSKTIPAIITSEHEYFKYSLGLFMTLKEAKTFRKELIKLGFEDAFVASYIDGKRQKIHD